MATPIGPVTAKLPATLNQCHQIIMYNPIRCFAVHHHYKHTEAHFAEDYHVAMTHYSTRINRPNYDASKIR
jgi:hypothetical protein